MMLPPISVPPLLQHARQLRTGGETGWFFAAHAWHAPSICGVASCQQHSFGLHKDPKPRCEIKTYSITLQSRSIVDLVLNGESAAR
jgi:hypothetical protein